MRSSIGTLRVRTAGQPTPALRLAWQAWAGGLELMPPGLPPSAVLIVRRLALAMPPAQARSGSATGPRWRVAATGGSGRVREALTEAWRRACRPSAGRVPEAAEAVLFADESELLACLAIHLSENRTRADWWTRVPLRSLPVPAADPAALLRQRLRELPAIACRLADTGQAHAVLAALGEADAAALLDALLQQHGLAAATAPRVTPATGARAAIEGAGEPLPAVPPWRRWLPTLPEGEAGGAREALLGTALALARAPVYARSPLFGARLRRWLYRQPAAAAVEGDDATRQDAAVSPPRRPSAASGALADGRAPETPPTPPAAAAPAIARGWTAGEPSSPPPRDGLLHAWAAEPA
ncbi:MAG TPA: hypothetical protein VES39_12805, partial [Rhodospirillales bacterium]|nr:hypothetical protein [Rhodospirillales bacterium]